VKEYEGSGMGRVRSGLRRGFEDGIDSACE